MREYDYVVLGGGVSALGFAKRVTDRGKSVLVLEKEAVVGGLSRTVCHDGFFLDFCAHRFHTKNEALLQEILSLDGLVMHKHIKKSRIYMFNKWLKYPFELQNLLRAMPLRHSLASALSFGWNLIAKKFRSRATLASYKDWFVYLYGNRLYEIMCRPYTSKIWHVDPGDISADWADQRFQGENLVRLFRRVVSKLLRLNFTSYDLADDSLAPDGGPFYYPLRGIQELPDALARVVAKQHGEIILRATVTDVNTERREVSYRVADVDHAVRYGTLISTIPLHAIYSLQERRDERVAQALENLRYMDIIFVYLFLNVPQVSNDHWLYFPDKDIIFNRAVEFSNWSPVMCPKGKTSICFDITAFAESPAWHRSDEELVARTIEDAVRVRYLKREQIVSHLVVRVKHAYPFYDLAYRQKLDVVVDFLETDALHLLGRTGVFRYNNSDNSIEMGFELADKLLDGDTKASAHAYTVKRVSY
jgi:protoporphyrinogen oxidase